MSSPAPDFQSLERLFAELQPLPPEAQEARLTELEAEAPELVSQLRGLLVVDSGTKDDSFLQDPPTFFLGDDTRKERVGQVMVGDVVAGYRIVDVIASGGMGTVYKAEQDKPRRTVALKVMHGGIAGPEARKRFEMEAEILGTLRHSGIAQVFDAGLHESPGGIVPYFVMEFIDGVELNTYAQDLDVNARLDLLASVCDAIEHAHQKGIIHRDLKPANILVDRAGQPKILDFGVARTQDAQLDLTSPVTVAGQIIGTVRYMSPEQTLGDPFAVDTRSDVYALGVLLHESLTGQLPYDIDGVPLLEAVRRIREDTPRPLTLTHRNLRGDVQTIVGKALEKEKQRRYPTASALALDIRRYLANEPIEARPPSAAYRASKFIRRNRLLVTSVTTIIVALAVSLVLVNAERERAQEERERADDEASAKGQALDEVQRLADMTRLNELEERAGVLWPAWPENLGAIRQWLKDVEPLLERQDLHRRKLEQLRREALPYDDDAHRRDHANTYKDIARHQDLTETLAGILQGTLAPNRRKQLESEHGELVAMLAERRARLKKRRIWEFDDPKMRWHHERLTELVAKLDRFTRGEHPVVGAIEKREREALALRERQKDLDEIWAATIEDIAGSRRYDELEIERVAGLAPLGKDPKSGLHEFLVLQSHAGPIPTRGDGGLIPVDENLGIILVLIPGGRATIGALVGPTTKPFHHPKASWNERPLDRLELDPYFIGKHEVTMGQWERTMGNVPNYYRPSAVIWGSKIDKSHPVETVSLDDCAKIAILLGLTIPTEAQWEHAARAGTNTPWFTGATIASLQGAANLSDKQASIHASAWNNFQPEIDDGHVLHAPVGSFRPNPFGLHDVHGNVWEWCRDRFAPSYLLPSRDGDGLRDSFGDWRTFRGGAFSNTAKELRVSHRHKSAATLKASNLGVRLAMTLRGL